MKKFILLLLSFSAKIIMSQSTAVSPNNNSPSSTAKTNAANNFKTLDINRVNAGIANRGDMHWDIFGTGNPSYEVPKGSNTHASFASAIWMGGLDAANQLHIAGQTYRQTGNDFWPGPLDTINATITSTNSTAYDNIWKVSYTDINNFITQYNLGNVPLSYTPTPDIVNWPAQGTGNDSRKLAPFVDVNGDGLYNWQNGDYPKIKGDMALFFIINDKLQSHSETGGVPLGVEIHCMAYAYGCPSVLNGRNELSYTTFYDYKIFNRSNNNYHDTYFGFWTDVDLGGYMDDYIGSHIQTNLGFCYNADSLDQSGGGANGYGAYPPAIGSSVLKGPLAPLSDLIDNDNDGLIDETGEECLMNVLDYYNNNIGSFPSATTNPTIASHYYGFLKAIWKDASNFTCNGNAFGGTTPTKCVYPWVNYPGNPCSSPWTESLAGNLAGDRRFVLSSGPFNLSAKSSTELEYALVWSVDSSATTGRNIASVNKLIVDVQKIRTFYQSSNPNCLLNITLGVNEQETSNNFISLYPNPSTSYIKVNSEKDFGKSMIDITDVSGRIVLTQRSDDLNQTIINTANLNSGIYFLNIKFGNNKSLVKKFIKQ